MLECFAFTCALSFSTTLFAQFGVLDPTFGSQGTVLYSLASNSNAYHRVKSMAIQNDGKIIIVGGVSSSASTSADATENSALVRFNVNGSIDNTFGLNGKVVMDFLNQNTQDEAFAVQIQQDNKIIVAGFVFSSTNQLLYFIMRLNTNGSLDTTFGTEGKITIAFDSNDTKLYAMVVQTDGKIIVGGNTPTYEFLLARFNANGSPDNTFGTAGTALGRFSKKGYVTSMVLQPDGKIVAAGLATSNNFSNYDFAVVRFLPNGTLDSNFGNGGLTTTKFIVGDSRPNGVAIQSDNKIVAVGRAITRDPIDVRLDDYWAALARYNENGSADLSFGGNGMQIEHSIDKFLAQNSLLIQPNGKIVTTGFLSLLRFNTDASSDNSFGSGGQIVMNSFYSEYVAMQPNGRIIVSGTNSNRNIIMIKGYTSGIRVGILDFSIGNNFLLVEPNPIKNQTTLHYTLQEDETISIQMFDMKGVLIKTFKENIKQTKGIHEELLSFQNDILFGNYIICISSPKGKTSVKVMKM